jgi:transketolase
MMSGVALHGGFLPYCGTFLLFLEYARNAVRMASLMKLHTILVYTHDSIGLGEDGPTHQPVEQIASLRMTPGMTTWRPADSVETAAAWKEAVRSKEGPVSLILSRQGLPVLPRDEQQVADIEKGAYVLWESGENPEYVVIATGSEVEPALKAAVKFAKGSAAVRVVSMPSPETFERQSSAYRDSVLPPAVTKRIAVEAAHRDFWYKYTGLNGCVIGMSTFGESAPAGDLMKMFGFTEENILEELKKL